MRDMEAVLDHETCPHCGSMDTYWNDSQADPDNDGSSFYMVCDACGKDYMACHVDQIAGRQAMNDCHYIPDLEIPEMFKPTTTQMKESLNFMLKKIEDLEFTQKRLDTLGNVSASSFNLNWDYVGHQKTFKVPNNVLPVGDVVDFMLKRVKTELYFWNAKLHEYVTEPSCRQPLAEISMSQEE